MSPRPALLIASAVLLAACGQVSVEDLAELEVGMPRPEVIALLGRPTECAGALTRPSCRWGNTERFIQVHFENDRVMMFSAKGLD
ncbi:hypothetical protein [Stutzerimonas tarimensis]|uniref:Outer membrane protein assembly factor BamE n=1 Tax=Stutzerimonas tarimensis TaxID=1507735 RepID=A0ABV7T428_9GAMM